MSPWRLWIGFAGLCTAVCVFCGAHAAQPTVSSRAHTTGSSFYEQTGVQWGFNYGGVSFNFGGPLGTAPAGQFGLSTNGAHGNLYFLGALGQGSRQTLSSQSPSITLSNGMPGFFADASVSPFVVGYYPIVAGFPPVSAANPLFGPATTVQLPTWSAFGTSTSVLVPDQGDALLGGVNRAAEGQNQFGPPGLPGQRAMGGQRGAANQQVHVTIHDFEAMDQALLAGGSTGVEPTEDSAQQALRAAQTSSAGRAAPGVAEAERQYAAERSAADAEALTHYQRGQAAEAEGKPGAAKVYYQMAVRRAVSEGLKKDALARLAAISSRDR